MRVEPGIRLLIVLVIALSALSACAFQPSPEPSKPQIEEVQKTGKPRLPEDPWANVDPSGQAVVFWHPHTGGREAALKEIIEAFNAANGWGITVEAEYQGRYSEIFDKMLVVLNTPEAPNLVVAYQDQAAIYHQHEGLVDMTALVDSPRWGLAEDDQGEFFPGVFAQDIYPIYGNLRLGFPLDRSMEVMYYNTEWLGELGYGGPPTTPEEFKEMACKATGQPFSKATAEGGIGYELRVNASSFSSWTFAHGGVVFDDTTNRYIYDSAETQEAMEFIQDLFDSDCATIVSGRDGDDLDFGAGKLLFKIGSSSSLSFVKKAVEEGIQFEWNVAVIPHTTPDAVQNIHGASVSIPRTTPEGELAAWLFLRYFTGAEVQAEWVETSNYFPVREGVAERLNDYFQENEQYRVAFEMLKFGAFEPPMPGYDFVRDKVSEALAAIADGADIASTLERLNAEANTVLTEQMISPTAAP